MTKKLNIPDTLQNSFQKLIRLLPYNLQSDVEAQNIILVYLKLGGEKMAHYGVEVLKMRFQEEIQDEIETSPPPDDFDSDVETDEDLDEDDEEEYSDSDYLDEDDDDDEDDYY